MEYLKRLTDYTLWANRIWLDLVYGAEPQSEYLARLVSHIYLAEQAWFQRIRGEEPDKEVFRTRAKDELLGLAERHVQRYAETLTRDLAAVLTYRRFNGEEYQSTLSDILLHLYTHGAHHRGQLAAYASQHAIPVPNSDLITFSRR